MKIPKRFRAIDSNESIWLYYQERHVPATNIIHNVMRPVALRLLRAIIFVN